MGFKFMSTHMDVRTLNSYEIDFLYTTTTLGVDPGYSNQSFYSGIMGKDTARVNGRFSAAAENGVRVERRVELLLSLLINYIIIIDNCIMHY